MYFPFGHQSAVRKIQRSWWCHPSFRLWCQVPRCACTPLHSYNRDNLDCRSIRTVVIVSEQAGLVFCSILPVKSRVTHCFVQMGKHLCFCERIWRAYSSSYSNPANCSSYTKTILNVAHELFLPLAQTILSIVRDVPNDNLEPRNVPSTCNASYLEKQ
jgi:hypothetical protein